MHEPAAVGAGGKIILCFSRHAVNENTHRFADIPGVLFGGNAVCRLQKLIKAHLLLLPRGRIGHFGGRRADTL